MKINRLEPSEIHRRPYIPKVEKVEKSQDKRRLKEHSVKDSNLKKKNGEFGFILNELMNK